MTADPLPVTRQICGHCGGEGMLYTSRYGGNDPDVWPTGECPVCEGIGYALFETEEVEEWEIMLASPEEQAAAVATEEQVRGIRRANG